MKHEDRESDAAVRAVAERLGRAAAERIDVERTAECAGCPAGSSRRRCGSRPRS